MVSTFCSLLLGSFCVAGSNLTASQSSQLVLQGDFIPPQVFENINLVRNTNLDKGYVRETINVVVQNVDKKPQSDYYFPFAYQAMAKVGGLEVRDKKDAKKGKFPIQVAGMAAASGEDGSPLP